MEKQIDYDKYTNPNGSVTKFQVDTYKNENQNPITVVRNSSDNQGQKFGETWQKRDEVTEKLATGIKEKFQIEDPKTIEMYQERQDGDFDRVKFAYRSNDQGEQVWNEVDRRTKYSKEELDQRLKEYEKGQHTEQDKMKLPSEDRSKFLENKEEITKYQNQVNKPEIVR